ncbi:uncharacterized protein MONOS_17701 [Monocercomonoides exilis]|uniref:uncharacterized protein n=1 Tax=Monocercomonoides exilis TaxID=2049356 RepID=UPI00355A7361|nr:hypothetical protein MONOS_17701 [Monocercomonoides exilis]
MTTMDINANRVMKEILFQKALKLYKDEQNSRWRRKIYATCRIKHMRDFEFISTHYSLNAWISEQASKQFVRYRNESDKTDQTAVEVFDQIKLL